MRIKEPLGLFQLFVVLLLLPFAPVLSAHEGPPGVDVGELRVFGDQGHPLPSRVVMDALGRTIAQDPGSFRVGVSDGGTTTFEANKQLSPEHFSGILISQNEPAIAFSPANPDNIVVGFHDRFPRSGDLACSYTFSTDGGSSWTFGGAVPLVKMTDFCSDPSIASDANGNFYYSYLSVRFDVSTSDVLVARSTDGGRTFSSVQFAVVGDRRTNFPDKEWIAVDTSPTSPFRGTVYVSYTDFRVGGNGQITLVSSRSFAQGFSPPLRISDNAVSPRAISGSMPFVAPDGTLYVAYADFIENTGPLAIRVAKVTGGGTVFAGTFTVASNLPSPGRFMLRNADPGFGSVSGAGFRSNSFPTAAAGPDGTLYVAWVQFPSSSACINDGSGRPPCEDAEVYFSKSTAGPTLGLSWSTPVRVHEPSDRDQFFPWLSVGAASAIDIIFGDKRLDPSNVVYNVFYTLSSDAGATFLSPNIRVTDASSNPSTDMFIGDYFNSVSTPQGVHVVWTDKRNGNDDIFASRSVSRRDIAVTSASIVLQAGDTHGFIGIPLNVTASVANLGDTPESFSVVLLANSTLVASQTLSLVVGGSSVLTLTWNTTGFSRGVYGLVVRANALAGEVDIANNEMTAGIIRISCLGDVDGDFDVDLDDVLASSVAWGTRPGVAGWNPNADFDNNDRVDLDDVLTTISRWGRPC